MTDIKTFIKMLKQVGVILDRKQKRQMCFVFFVILIGSVLELLGISAILPFMESLLTPEVLKERWYIAKLVDVFHITDNHQLIVAVGASIILIYVLKNLYMIWSSYIQSSYNCRVQKELSVQMYRSYMRRPYEFFVSSDSGQIMRGINKDASSVYIVVQHIFKFTTQVVTMVVIIAYLFMLNPSMTFGVMMLGAICFVCVAFGIKRKISKAGDVARNTDAALSDWAIQTIAGMKDIFVFDSRDYAEDKYDSLYNDQVKANTLYNFIQMIPTYFIEMVCASGMIVLILLQIGNGVSIESFVPDLSVFAMGAFRLLPAIAASSGYISVFIFHRPSIEGAYENITGARAYMAEVEDLSSEGENPREFADRIEIKGIEWSYAGRDKKVLDNLSMTIEKGESIGIVGESGSGKSTFADVLLNLYKPQKGSIFMDGIDISTIPVSWNSNLAYVSQVIFLLNDTIRANVAFCTDDVDDKRVWKALEEASLADYVRGLPEGLDTVVGERGMRFSGGQRQRIAIARALYTDPEILILDEATSALDNETEESVMKAIDNLKGKLTMIIIAHRLTTLRKCDRIYEIRGGKAYNHAI